MSQPAGRAPAPPPLDEVQVFVNTVDLLDGKREALTDPEAARGWVESAGHTEGPPDLGPVELDSMIEVREAIRTLCHHNRDERVDPSRAHAVLNAAAARSGLALDFADGGRLSPVATGVDRFLGSLLGVIQAAMLDGSWCRLKACNGCGWVFHDGSRSRISRWCSMTICGNRAKSHAHRERHATTPNSTQPTQRPASDRP